MLRQSSAADIATRLRFGRSEFRFPVRVTDFSLPQKRPDRNWGALSLLFNGYRVSFIRVKRPGHEENHSPPCSAEVKNEWSCTHTAPYTPSLRGHGQPTYICCIIRRSSTTPKTEVQFDAFQNEMLQKIVRGIAVSLV
jgi:hypothetical protein